MPERICTAGGVVHSGVLATWMSCEYESASAPSEARIVKWSAPLKLVFGVYWTVRSTTGPRLPWSGPWPATVVYVSSWSWASWSAQKTLSSTAWLTFVWTAPFGSQRGAWFSVMIRLKPYVDVVAVPSEAVKLKSSGPV